MKAPEFSSDTRWLNTDKPLSLAALRGHVVLLDFWTYCCINCLHTLPRLAELERAYAGQPVLVIGVHSGKFDQEHNDERVREAIAKYDVRHPVAMDDDFTIWNAYSVHSWPTLILVDPSGKIADTFSGEPEPGQLEKIVGRMLDDARKAGTLAKAPAFAPKAPVISTDFLRFPGKVLALDGRLFIADTGHHRVLIADKNGKVSAAFGTGQTGFKDGPAAEAQFNEPQGLALNGNVLYVADRSNHAIRALDLSKEKVTTIAGAGKKGSWSSGGGAARETDLRSPWDLSLREGGLDIAMAGSHQIWRLSFTDGKIAPLAGSGAENIIDGSFSRSAFAQPSGLWFDGDYLFVADSETSAVRILDPKEERVGTLVGTGLFDFGMKDGTGRAAQLQHPIGIAGKGDLVYVADSFNNAIRIIDLAKDALVTTLKIGGVGPLKEPQGLSVDGDTLYVADTNNHRIVAVNLKTNEAKLVALKMETRPR
ncbi:MAG: alkyl hydroperoxide reductase [Myxococcales bacterium]|nr:MAG: alkyl hydroperoxide reductase [Myxococcales bacterium]